MILLRDNLSAFHHFVSRIQLNRALVGYHDLFVVRVDWRSVIFAVNDRMAITNIICWSSAEGNVAETVR